MNRYDHHVHVQATVGAQGSVILDHLPFKPGQRVDVTISPISAPDADGTSRYPLSGMKVEYDWPFESAAGADWEATQ